jgi:hypothetical protein
MVLLARDARQSTFYMIDCFQVHHNFAPSIQQEALPARSPDPAKSILLLPLLDEITIAEEQTTRLVSFDVSPG